MAVPWKSDERKKARCGMCQSGNGVECANGHELKYPLITNEHKCRDYQYDPYKYDRTGDYLRNESFHAKLLFTHCFGCTFEFGGLCSGKKWIPVKMVNDKCEFFKPKSVACSNCVPMNQYGNLYRNNYCRLPPHLRQGDEKRGWKWMCPGAHNPDKVRGKKCYKPLGRH
jgi:hypothetical protein